MGQFSWLDCKTGEQIIDDRVRDVFLLVPKEFGGGHIKETCYDGYGNFGGYDAYAIVATWNRKYLAENPKHKLYKSDFKKDYFITVDMYSWYKAYSNLDLTDDEVKERVSTDWRCIGIDIACYDIDNASLKYPLKMTHDPDAVYEDCKPSPGDPDQGWLMSDEEDENDEW